MKAMIFAAGLGTRLRPLTDHCPKALVEVAGKPLLAHVIERLKSEGFDQLVINIHHFGEQIIRYLDEQHRFGIQIVISDERDYLLDTGGGIKKARQFLDGDSFLVHNVDILSDAPLKELFEVHVASGAEATLLVSDRNSSRKLIFNRENRLTGWTNLSTGEIKTHYPLCDYDLTRQNCYAFSGIHVMSPRIFEDMEPWTGRFPIIDFYLSVCPHADIRCSFDPDLNLFDVGKPEAIAAAEQWIRQTNGRKA